MFDLLPGELAYNRLDYGSSLTDLLLVMVYSEEDDQYGQPKAVYTPGRALRCGYDPTGSSEITTGRDSITYDATVRLSWDDQAALKAEDKVQIMVKDGVPLRDPPTYRVLGFPKVTDQSVVTMLQETRL